MNTNEHVYSSNYIQYISLLESVIRNVRLKFGYYFAYKNGYYCTFLPTAINAMSFNFLLVYSITVRVLMVAVLFSVLLNVLY